MLNWKTLGCGAHAHGEKHRYTVGLDTEDGHGWELRIHNLAANTVEAIHADTKERLMDAAQTYEVFGDLTLA